MLSHILKNYVCRQEGRETAKWHEMNESVLESNYMFLHFLKNSTTSLCIYIQNGLPFFCIIKYFKYLLLKKFSKQVLVV